MRIDARILGRLAVLSAALVALAGCLGGGGSDSRGPAASAPKGVEGEWLSSDGVAVSRLTGGVFTTNALDTGNKLADGTYRINGNMAEITVISLIRNTTTNVNCLLVSPNQMNCTSSAGQQFVLNRRPARTA